MPSSARSTGSEPQDRKAEPVTEDSLPTPSAPAPSNLHIGTSGWAYPTWKPAFYPDKLHARRFLEHYGTQLNAVEVNYTFRQLPTARQLAGWLEATPPDFRFCFKAPQRITHTKRLRDCEDAFEAFLLSLEPVHEAGRLGPCLLQLPPNMKADVARLREFLQIPALQSRPHIRLSFEFRHESWFSEPTYTTLHDAKAALCIADTDDLTTPEVHTAADLRSFRLRHDGGYSPAKLRSLAKHFAALSQDAPTYAFLRHQEEPTGALNALTLRRLASRGATS